VFWLGLALEQAGW